MSRRCNRTARVFSTFVWLMLVLFLVAIGYQHTVRGRFGREYVLHQEADDGYSQQGQCHVPTLELWNKDLMKLYKHVTPTTCPGDNWVTFNHGFINLTTRVRDKYEDVKCYVKPFYRNTDFDVTYADRIKLPPEGLQIASDFVEVNCRSRKHAKKFSQNFMSNYRNESVWSKAPPTDKNKLNVLIFGFDSTSRLAWLRNLPKSHQYFTEELGGLVMERHNIVGDGTTENLNAMLTGKREKEMYEARKGIKGSRTLDWYPWIFNDFKAAGYVTQWTEDAPDYATYHYRLLGFKNKPVHHMMRSFYLETEAKNYCHGSRSEAQVAMDVVTDLFETYQDRPKFSLTWLSDYSHDHTSQLKSEDNNLLQWLKDMKEKKYLENTLLILMADHGIRYTAVRELTQGKFEERLPYTGLAFPESFKLKHPQFIESLKNNTKILTTGCDLHATFKHLLNTGNKSVVTKRGQSLLSPLNPNRTCEDIDIPHHWCSCLDWKPLKNSTEAAETAKYVIKEINKLVSKFTTKCYQIRLKKLVEASVLKPKKKLLQFKGTTIIKNKGIANFGNAASSDFIFYAVTFVTSPNDARYEATARYDVKAGVFTMDTKDISRTNRYGNQPACIQDEFPHLYPYCQCKSI